ncbi:g2830 [Coccomyxa elongata]
MPTLALRVVPVALRQPRGIARRRSHSKLTPRLSFGELGGLPRTTPRDESRAEVLVQAREMRNASFGNVREAPTVAPSFPNQDIPSIEAEEAGKLVMAAKAAFLDVRTSSAFAAEHVAGAFNVPWLLEADAGKLKANEQFLSEVEQILPDKDQDIVVACQIGMRGPPATLAMRSAGYTNAYNVKGGLNAWKAINLPTIK